jgi:hypothetical protein
MKLMVKLIAQIPFFSSLSEEERTTLAADDSLFEVFNDGDYIVVKELKTIIPSIF